MDSEALVIYGNAEIGNEFLGYVKVSQITSGMKDREIDEIKWALRQSDRITTVRVDQFLKESTSGDGTVDKQKFLCLVSQEIISNNWVSFQEFLQTTNLQETLRVETEEIGKHAKISTSKQAKTSRQHGFFVYKINGWTGELEELDQILNDVVKYYKDFKKMDLKPDTDYSTFVPKETPKLNKIKLFPRKLIGLEEIPVNVCGIEFTSKTPTKVLLYSDQDTKNVFLLIHGRALFGERDWEGKITGLTPEGNAEFVSKILAKFRAFGPAKCYDVLYLIASEIFK